VASANIRFFDSQSALVWNELSSGQAFNLIPVRDVGADQLTCELTELRRIYGSESPHVFLHVSETESDTDGVVVWAVRRSGWTLLHAVASAPIADTIVEIALALPIKAVFFVWEPHRFSLAKYYLLRCIGRRTAVPLDTMWQIRRAANGNEPRDAVVRHTVATYEISMAQTMRSTSIRHEP
jgi:hypothetical protein